MKTALVTMLDENFVIGFDVMMKSLKANNPWFDLPVVVIDLGLTEMTKARLRSEHRIEFRAPKRKNYAAVNFSKTAERLRSTYYKLDVFSYDDFDRIVFIDSDVVITGDIAELFACDKPFAAVRGYNAREDQLRADINSGVFVVNKPALGGEYKALLRIAERGFSMPDQKAINLCFAGRIHHLPKMYNVEKRMIATKRFQAALAGARIVHFVASKPWDSEKEPGFEDLEKIWLKYHG